MLFWVIIVLITCWMALKYLPAGWDQYRPLPEVIALIPLLVVPLVLLLPATGFTGNWPQFGVTVVLLLVQAAWQIGYVMPIPSALAPILGVPVQTLPVDGEYADSSFAAETESSDDSTKSADDYPQTSSVLPQPVDTDASSTDSADVTSTATADDHHTIRVMTLNTRYGRADTGTIMHLVKQENIDILAVQEVNTAFIKRLDISHIGDELPYRVLGAVRDDDNAGSNALFMRLKPAIFGDSSVNISAAAAPVATVRIGDQCVEFSSVHPKSPPRSGKDWSDGVRALGQFALRADSRNEEGFNCCADDDMAGTGDNVADNGNDVTPNADLLAGLPPELADIITRGVRDDSDEDSSNAEPAPDVTETAVIELPDFSEPDRGPVPHHAAVVMGDMNSSIYHPSFRDALRQGSGLADSSFELHAGFNTTFPASWPTFPSLIEIDHVLHTQGIRARSAHAYTVPKTDHKALVVELEVA
ncbi:endonuclease/exonuclease/phosphatase family protein [Bifidobacterium callimiconis]|uniref:Endonuclease n=1 Tax=Bifidobacterium callimiconis TaxID=2306973 RepID=A0A430FBG5_9BIFI|nr:endonuclease/exonuclease/phosphatase family protein [Bifidobacterium callimiconis]RSX50186.1 endonuclease [Bifidobacterium callimiconis]